jgi:hypothetical protein
VLCYLARHPTLVSETDLKSADPNQVVGVPPGTRNNRDDYPRGVPDFYVGNNIAKDLDQIPSVFLKCMFRFRIDRQLGAIPTICLSLD